MGIQEKLVVEIIPGTIDGIVEETVLEGPPRIKRFVRGATVYERRSGGIDMPIGYVFEGKAYQNVLGGTPRFMGIVKPRPNY